MNSKMEWICTDPDTSQYCKKINDYSYRFVEIREMLSQFVVCCEEIDIRDYSLDDLWNYCSGYYDSYEQIFSQYGVREAFRIIAECVFEQLGFDDMEYIFVQASRADSIRFIHEYMNKNLTL